MSEIVRLTLVSHAMTDATAAGRFPRDEPLNALGQRQIDATTDLGSVDAEGFVRIVDRKKELIITASGKNISPANLEAALKAQPLIGQACAIGDGEPYIVALVVLDAEIAGVWAARHGIDAGSVPERQAGSVPERQAAAPLAFDPRVVAEIAHEVHEANERF